MYRQPRSLAQLKNRLQRDYVEIFPYGKHKDKLVSNVVDIDPNYIVWWNQVVVNLPLDPKIVEKANRNYKHLDKCGHWQYSLSEWDHWGGNDD